MRPTSNGGTSPRLAGWESRLAAVIEAARHREYQLGTHDCFRLSCAVVEALTGTDLWPEYAGRYLSRRESLVLMATKGTTFDACFDRVFGVPRGPTAHARRGDIVKYTDPKGEHHLGICLGADIAVLDQAGLVFLPRTAATHCWAIG